MPRNLLEPDPKNAEGARLAQAPYARLDPEEHKGDDRVVQHLSTDDYDELEVDHFGVAGSLFDDDDAYEVEDDDIYETVDLDRLERGDGPDA